MTRTAAIGFALGTLFASLAGAAAPVPARKPAAHAAPAPAPAPLPDPIRAEFDAAIAPGLGDSTSARLGRFLVAHPRHPLATGAQFELGTLAYVRGDYGNARERFRRARAGALTDEARYWEGLAAFALGRTRDARDAALGLTRSRKDGPRRWDSAYLVALSWAQEGRRPEALAAYKGLFDLPAGPMQAAALYQAQRLAAGLARTDDASAWGRKLLAVYPNSPEAASFRAESPVAARPTPAKGPSTPRPGLAPDKRGKPGKPAAGR